MRRPPLSTALRVLAALLFVHGCVQPGDDLAVLEGELTVCAEGPVVEGIDVSSWQGTIDWDAVAGSGIGFAIVRIGDGTYHDREFERNWAEVRRVGLVRGAYQFFRPDTDPLVQADLVIAAVGRLGPGDLPVTIDVESPSPMVGPAEYARRIGVWIDRVTEGTGRAPIIYTGRYYWDPYVASSAFREHPLWHAQYTSAACPNINDRWGRWAFWQYTSSGSIAGIAGRIDRDVFNGTRADLDALATVVPDEDGDGSPAGVDCDDADARRFPGRAESCDGQENDCDGAIDEDLVRRCGSDVGACTAGTQGCDAGAWGACLGEVAAVPEQCNGQDDDCDGAQDEAQVCELEEASYDAAILASSQDSDVDGDGRADACARGAGGFACLLVDEDGFSRSVPGPSALGEGAWVAARAFGLRMADLDDDGRADLCDRRGDEVTCWASRGDGFGDALARLSLEPGATSFELADIDGDGQLDGCARGASGLRCALFGTRLFERVVLLPALSDAAGFSDVIHHGTLRFGDVDGDGRSDVCARGAEGVDCWLGGAEGFEVRWTGPRWSDASGFASLSRWSTLRLADVSGDGRDDLCARTPEGFRCALAGDAGFESTTTGPPMDEPAWDTPAVFSTLRMGDVDGDGRADVCASMPDRVRCWLAGDGGFGGPVLGPALGAEASDVAVQRSVRLADVTGDGRADLCVRPASGLRCHASDDAGFGAVLSAPAERDPTDAGSRIGAATLRIAGGRGVRAGLRPGLVGEGCAVVGPGTASGGGSLGAWLAAIGLGLVASWGRRRRAR